MYVLLNREGIVVNITNSLRFTTLLSQSNIVVGCDEESQATGIVGSDGKQYPLIKADTMNNPNAVSIIELEDIPYNVKPNKYKYDFETESFVYRYTLDETKAMKQEENKALFAEFLATHPLTWIDGKEYGITEQDQAEIGLNLDQYRIATEAGVKAPTLEWHAKHEECKPWTLGNLNALSLSISAAVYPTYHQMQRYKTQIYACETIEEVEDIELIYEE